MPVEVEEQREVPAYANTKAMVVPVEVQREFLVHAVVTIVDTVLQEQEALRMPEEQVNLHKLEQPSV
jgi:hypothetical protein